MPDATFHHCPCGRTIPLRFSLCRPCELRNYRHSEARPTFDGDTRALVTRCALRGIPVGVVNANGDLVIVRNLDDLDAETAPRN